jgi:sugar fermentation stimulation protein A
MRRSSQTPSSDARRRLVSAISLPIEAALPGRLIRRYKRFLADVALDDGTERTVHCPNPGRMQGTSRPGATVRCSTHDDPRRKLRHTLEMIRVGRIWVGLHAARANDLARAVLEAGAYTPFRGYPTLEREVSVAEGSRFDFRLEDQAGKACWIEVKSVTLCDRRLARFPDAVTARGRRHLEHLIERRRAGERAALLFIVQRADADRVAPADEIDPEYGVALRAAAAAGVEIHALGARVLSDRLRAERVLPIDLSSTDDARLSSS